MAEFCFECYKKYFDENAEIERLVMDDGDLCEGCAGWKPCVIKVKELSFWDELLELFGIK